MTINTDLLVAAPMLQNYLVDKDTGMPLVNGIVTLYKDTARKHFAELTKISDRKPKEIKA